MHIGVWFTQDQTMEELPHTFPPIKGRNIHELYIQSSHQPFFSYIIGGARWRRRPTAVSPSWEQNWHLSNAIMWGIWWYLLYLEEQSKKLNLDQQDNCVITFCLTSGTGWKWSSCRFTGQGCLKETTFEQCSSSGFFWRDGFSGFKSKTDRQEEDLDQLTD